MTTVKLSSLVDIVSAASLNRDLFSDDPSLMPVIMPDDFYTGVPGIFSKEKIKDSKFIAKSGDILVSNLISFEVALWEGPAGYFTDDICKLELKDERINKNYLYHILSENIADVEGVPSTNKVPRITIKDLGDLQIEFPEIHIQQQIAHVLDMSKRIIGKRIESIKALDDLLQSSYIHLFGDPASNSKNWPLLKFPELGSLDRGTVKKGESPEEGLPLVEIRQILDAGIYLRRDGPPTAKKITKRGGVVPKGALCITTTIGTVSATILDFEAALAENITAFLPNEKTNAEFMYFWFEHFARVNFEQSQAKVGKKINERMFREIDIICPSITLQNSFSNLVKRVESIKAKAFESNIAAHHLNHSLIQQTLNGELAKQFEFENYLKAGMPLTKDIVAGPPIQFKKPFSAQRFKDIYNFLAKRIARYNKEHELDDFEKKVKNILEGLDQIDNAKDFADTLRANDLNDVDHDAIEQLQKWFGTYDTYHHVEGRWNWDVVRNERSNFSSCYQAFEEFSPTNAFFNFSDATRSFRKLIQGDLEKVSRSIDEEYEKEEKKYLGEDPLSQFSKQSDFDEDVPGGLSVLEVIKENNIQEFNISSLRESIRHELEFRGADDEYERQITEEKVEEVVNKMLDKFLLHEMLDQPFTFQQLQQALSAINFKPDFYTLHNYIFGRLQEEGPFLKQAYFNENMVNVNPAAYQYLRNTMDPQLMGDQVFTPPRRLYLIYSLPKTRMPDAVAGT